MFTLPTSLKAQQEDTGLHRQRGEQEKLKRRKSENMGGGSAIAGFETQILRPTPPHHHPQLTTGDGVVHSGFGVIGAELEPWGLRLNVSPN